MIRLPYIDAMRGYAILMVVAVHASQLIATLPWAARALADQGARGVQLFFVASALTLMQSWHRRNDGAWPFYIRRVFRIAPMFWLATIFFSGLAWWRTSELPWAKAVVTLAFVHGLHPATIDGIVPGGWSIADEMMFYAVFPVLAAWITNWRVALGALAACGVIATVLRPILMYVFVASAAPEQRDLVAEYLFLWFPHQLPVFLVGILVYQATLQLRGRISQRAARAGILCAVIAAVALALLCPTALLDHAFALVFGLFALCLPAAGILVNAAIAWIGKVSYSAYLWHFALIYLFADRLLAWRLDGLSGFAIMFVALTVPTLAGSMLTYHLVEAPMIRIGGVVAARFARRGAMLQYLKDVSRPARRRFQARAQRRALKHYKIGLLSWLASSEGPPPSAPLKSIAVGPLTWVAIWRRWLFEGDGRFPRPRRSLRVLPGPRTKISALRSYARRYGLRTFIETGTHVGSTVAALSSTFDRCITIEMSASLHAQASERFRSLPHVTCLIGDSSSVLPKVLATLDQPALFWLDAHTSGGDTANPGHDPVMAELAAIYSHPIRRHVILIDDARGHNLKQIAGAVPPHMQIVVRNDVVRITPPLD